MATDSGWITSSALALDSLTLGNGTNSLRYRVADGRLLFMFQFVFGSTSVLTSAQFTVWIPSAGTVIAKPSWAARTSDGYSAYVGSVACNAYDASADTWYNGAAVLIASWTDETNLFTPGAAQLKVRPRFGNAAATATAPFTWATGDILVMSNAVEAFTN